MMPQWYWHLRCFQGILKTSAEVLMQVQEWKLKRFTSSLEGVCRSFEDSLEVVLETPCVLTLLGDNKGFKTSLKGPFWGLFEDDFCTTFAHWVVAGLWCFKWFRSTYGANCSIFQMWPHGNVHLQAPPHDVCNIHDCHWCICCDLLNLTPVWHTFWRLWYTCHLLFCFKK